MKKEKINDGLSVYQLENNLAFGTDAYLLSAYIQSDRKANACELGSGSGVISLLLASRNKIKHSTGFEIQEELIPISAKNAEENGFRSVFETVHGDVRSLPSVYNGAFDITFTNPPYLPRNSGLESESPSDRISRRECNGGIEDFISCAAKLTKFGGKFYAVYRPERSADIIFYMKKYGIEPKRLTYVYPTTEHPPCLMLIEGKRGGKSGIMITKPLYIYNGKDSMCNENYTDDMKYIYANGDFNEFYKKF